MNWIRTIGHELYGLFVDDGLFAGCIVGWIALCALLLPRTSLPAGKQAGLLFAGLAVILLESSIRRARTAARRS